MSVNVCAPTNIVSQILEPQSWYLSARLDALPKCVLAHVVPTALLALAMFPGAQLLPLVAIEVIQISFLYSRHSFQALGTYLNFHEDNMMTIFRISRFVFTLLFGGAVSQIFHLSFQTFATYFLWIELVHAVLDGLYSTLYRCEQMLP